MKFFLLSAIFFLLNSSDLMAQRYLNVRDSTTYSINSNDTIIAGKYKIYKKQNGVLTPIHEFNLQISIGGNFTERAWIRDFDFFDSQKWFVLLGRSTVGGNSVLYKTTDAGLNWQIDTSYYSASINRSLNQVQVIDAQNVFLFDGYYFSDVLKTNNGGQTWQNWISSVFTNHYGFFICDSNNYYLWGTEGDGFQSYMFKIPPAVFTQLNNKVQCNQNPDCIEAPGIGYDSETHFKAIADSLCAQTVSNNELDNLNNGVKIYPNPSVGIYKIESDRSDLDWSCYNVFGQLILFGTNNFVDISSYPIGVYFLRIKYLNGKYSSFQLIKN